MVLKIDFSLSGRFGVVEQTIFRLVLSGVKDVRTITVLLSVYSNEVIANAIKKLVNYQILRANLETRTLAISKSVLAVIEGCLEKSQHLELPEESKLTINDGGTIITDYEIKRQILKAILPGVNTGFLVKSLDFVVCERGVQDEQ